MATNRPIWKKPPQTLMQRDFDLILLPELFSTGSSFLSKKQVYELSEAVPEGETTQALFEIAKVKSAYIITGMLEREGEQLYNTAIIVGPEGLIGKHRKVNLTPPDIWFPQAAQALVQQKVDIIFNPSNFCGEDTLATIIQQAKTSGVYIVAANRLGMDHDVETGVQFIGSSLIVNPEGEVLERAGHCETFTVCSIP